MSAVLRISGQDLDCDEAVRHCPIEPCSLSRRGEPEGPRRPDAIRIRSGVNLCLSEAGFDDFAGQIDETIEFLKQNRDALSMLLGLNGIEGASICFGLRWRDTFTHTDLLPAELVQLAGALNIGIELSHYPISDADDVESPLLSEPA